jgi:TM2 domain-containing membrane protein YozV
MKKYLVFVVLAAALAAPASAQQDRPVAEHPDFGLQSYLDEVFSSGRTVGDLSFRELGEALERLSVIVQQRRFVERSGIASFALPGVGQFMNGDPLTGTLHFALNLAATAGTLIGAYLLLPEDLKFGSTDYLADSFDTIKARFMSHSLSEYLPAMAVMVGGGIVKWIVRGISSAHAKRLALENIETGRVAFEPEIGLLLMPDGSFGLRAGVSVGRMGH